MLKKVVFKLFLCINPYDDNISKYYLSRLIRKIVIMDFNY